MAFENREGKIAPSWSGLESTDPKYDYFHGNSLWHHHIGLPVYSQEHPAYKTSDWLLYFQWVNKGPRIELVDLYQHHKSDGTLDLPGPQYLNASATLAGKVTQIGGK